MGYSVTITLTSKNRKEELRNAIASSLQQTVFDEIIVIDDGSSDGTADLVRQEFPAVEFPKVKLHRFDESEGVMVQRNRAAALAKGDIIVSIDDDAVFSSPQVIEQTLNDFDHPRIGAVSIPHIDVLYGNQIHGRGSNPARIEVTDCFRGTAYAVRRDVFLGLGGFRSSLIHQGEERDFCLRLLDAGYVVRLGHADPIHHFESPRRDFRRMDYFGRRNDVLFAWHNLPWRYAIPHMLATTGRGLYFGLSVGRPWRMVEGLASGYATCLSQWSEHRPVAAKVYRIQRQLKKRGPRPLLEIEHDLPTIRPALTTKQFGQVQ